MARQGPHRFTMRLAPGEYARLQAHAMAAGRPVATVARGLLVRAMDGHDPDEAPVLHRERERIRRLEAEVGGLQSELARRQAAADLAANLPRWRWPLEPLLADRAWWDEWLPRLGELIGRHLQYEPAYRGPESRPVVDERGYADLLGYLFPDLVGERGARISWHWPQYPRLARRSRDRADGSSSTRQRPVRAEVWEPVVRHVALALTALETTSRGPSDAYTHLRVEAEIRGDWLRTLGALLGEGGSRHLDQLPRRPLP